MAPYPPPTLPKGQGPLPPTAHPTSKNSKENTSRFDYSLPTIFFYLFI